jgi:hypothetical protein
LGAISQKIEDNGTPAGFALDISTGVPVVTPVAATTGDSYTAHSVEIGAKIAVGAFGLVGYYYDGDSVDSNTNLLGIGGLPFRTGGVETDDDGGYVQGTFTIPGIGTKLGLSYGESNSEVDGGGLDVSNKSWIVGAYHPLTKSLNLVAEYTDNEIETNSAVIGDLDSKTISLGAIMFF